MVDNIALNEIVIRGTDESKTDTFVNYLLTKTGFTEYPFILRLKPMYEFKVHHKTITSIYDFSVEKNNKILLVEEDKHIRNTTHGTAWGEYKIAGEVIAGSYNNYVLHTTYSEILVIRVIRTRFTFYYTIIPLDYLDSLSYGLPNIDITIDRYPDGLEYKNPDDRVVIIDVLLKIKYKLEII